MGDKECCGSWFQWKNIRMRLYALSFEFLSVRSMTAIPPENIQILAIVGDGCRDDRGSWLTHHTGVPIYRTTFAKTMSGGHLCGQRFSGAISYVTHFNLVVIRLLRTSLHSRDMLVDSYFLCHLHSSNELYIIILTWAYFTCRGTRQDFCKKNRTCPFALNAVKLPWRRLGGPEKSF